MEKPERTEHTSLTDRTQDGRPQHKGGTASTLGNRESTGQNGESSQENRPASRRRNRHRRRARRRSSTASAPNTAGTTTPATTTNTAKTAGRVDTSNTAKKKPPQKPKKKPAKTPAQSAPTQSATSQSTPTQSTAGQLTSTKQPTPDKQLETEYTRAADAHTQFSPVHQAPFAIVTVQTNGIHPKTGRMVSLGISTADEQGKIVDTWHVVIDPHDNPGPTHLHGLQPEDFEGAPRFSVIQSKLAHALDGRILITHNAPRVWGFIVAEAKRARRQANRENIQRRNRNRRYRPRVGKIPAPTIVIDTLATARRQGKSLSDTRLRGVARAYGLDVPSPVASEAGRLVPERVRTLDDIATTWALFIAEGGLAGFASDQDNREISMTESADQWPDSIAATATKDLKEDKVGLQRSMIRVEAMEAPRPVENPGKYAPGGRVKPGMEFAIAPQVTADPDVLIEAGMTAGLVYSEKVTRETSLLVCNRPADVTPDKLTGKAMHAHRKEIPMVSDTAFLRLVQSMG